MAVTLNASTSSGFIATSDTSGDLALQANGSTKMTIGSSITMNSGGLITSGTAQNSTSGTSIDFTGIPSWVKRITVVFNGVSTNGSATIQVQLGTSAGPTTSGYSGALGTIVGSAVGTAAFSSGFIVAGSVSAASTLFGSVIISNITGNTWACSGVVSRGNEARADMIGGAVGLSATLDRVRITTGNGTDTFDAGTINILYEG